MKVININVNKTKKVGISFPFESGNVFTATTSTKDQVKANLVNFVMTDKGERLYNPDFGTNLRSYLYATVPDVQSVVDTVKADINKHFMGTVEIIDLQFDLDDLNQILALYLEYYIIDSNTTDQIAINFN